MPGFILIGIWLTVRVILLHGIPREIWVMLSILLLPLIHLVATALISSADYGYWGILNDGSDGYFGVYTGFSNANKWKALSSGIGKSKAGVGDISEVTSGGPFTISAGDTLELLLQLLQEIVLVTFEMQLQMQELNIRKYLLM